MQLDQIKVGATVIQTQNPEYGTWFIKRPYYDGMWEVHKCARPSDGICIGRSELLKFWQLAK